MKINLVCPINKLSYGYVSINILKELIKEHEVSLFNLNEIRDDDLEDENKPIVHQALFNRQNHDPYAPTVIIWHHFDLKKHKLFKGKHYGFPIFEVSTFNKNDIEQIESMDGIFVTCKWYQNVVKKYSNIPCNVVNLGCSEIKRDLVEERKLRDLKETNFLVAGKWEIRKAQKEIIECFNRTFFKSSRVKLNLLCENFFIGPKENKKWECFAKESKLGTKINIIPRLKNHSEVIDLMRNQHFGIFVSKAEGWNLELHEMMTLGKPCIATNYSAHTEYCNKDNSYLVDINEEEIAYDGIFFHGQGNWAKLGKTQLDSICCYMKYLHEKRLDKEVFCDINRTVEILTWKNSAYQILRYLTT